MTSTRIHPRKLPDLTWSNLFMAENSLMGSGLFQRTDPVPLQKMILYDSAASPHAILGVSPGEKIQYRYTYDHCFGFEGTAGNDIDAE